MSTVKTAVDLIEDNANEKGSLPNQQPGPVFRLSMENKNLLHEKGSIYVGTGETNDYSLTANGGTSEYKIAETMALEAPSDPNYTLVTDPTSSCGLAWKSVVTPKKIEISASSSWQESSEPEELGRASYKYIYTGLEKGDIPAFISVLKYLEGGSGSYEIVYCDIVVTYEDLAPVVTLYSDIVFNGALSLVVFPDTIV